MLLEYSAQSMSNNDLICKWVKEETGKDRIIFTHPQSEQHMLLGQGLSRPQACVCEWQFLGGGNVEVVVAAVFAVVAPVALVLVV